MRPGSKVNIVIMMAVLMKRVEHAEKTKNWAALSKMIVFNQNSFSPI